MFQWVRNSEGRLIKVNVLQESNSKLNISFDQMEHLEGEQHCQYPMERKPNAYRSMRDYTNPPWVSAPSYRFLQLLHHMAVLTTLVGGTT